MKIDASDSIIPGGRYHNRRDYMNFPNLGRFDLLYQQKQPLPVEGLSLEGSILNKIAQKDFLISAPYQSFSYIIKFLREAALDPKVTTIKITLYRLAKNSQIISSLINAAKMVSVLLFKLNFRLVLMKLAIFRMPSKCNRKELNSFLG